MNNPINKFHGLVKNIVMAFAAIMIFYLGGSSLLGRDFTTFDAIFFIAFASVVTLQWFIGLMNLGVSIVQEGFQPKWQIEHLIWTSLAIGCLHGASNVPTPTGFSRFAVLLGLTIACFFLIGIAIWRMKMTKPVKPATT
jgi:hypothetical protein